MTSVIELLYPYKEEEEEEEEEDDTQGLQECGLHKTCSPLLSL
jgi:hypothetical protein